MDLRVRSSKLTTDHSSTFYIGSLSMHSMYILNQILHKFLFLPYSDHLHQGLPKNLYDINILNCVIYLTISLCHIK